MSRTDHVRDLLYDLHFGSIPVQDSDGSNAILYAKQQIFELLNDSRHSSPERLSRFILKRHESQGRSQRPSSCFYDLSDRRCVPGTTRSLKESLVSCFELATQPQTLSNSRCVPAISLYMLVDSELLVHGNTGEACSRPARPTYEEARRSLIEFYEASLYKEKTIREWERDFFNPATVHLFIAESYVDGGDVVALSKVLSAVSFSLASSVTDEMHAYVSLIRSERSLDLSPDNIVLVMNGMFVEESGRMIPTNAKNCVERIRSIDYDSSTYTGIFSDTVHRLPLRKDAEGRAIMGVLQSMLSSLADRRGYTLFAYSVGYEYRGGKRGGGTKEVSAREIVYEIGSEAKGKEFWKRYVAQSREACLLGYQLVLSGDVALCCDCMFMSRAYE